MSDPFDLTASDPTGLPPETVIAELRAGYQRKRDAGADFTEAVGRVAERHKIAKGALKRYIVALESDTTDALEKEAEDVERLLR